MPPSGMVARADVRRTLTEKRGHVELYESVYSGAKAGDNVREGYGAYDVTSRYGRELIH